MEEDEDGEGIDAVASILATIRDMDLTQIRHIIGEVTDNDPAVVALLDSVFDDEENKTREEIFGLLEQVLLHAFGGSGTGENVENEKPEAKPQKKTGAKSDKVSSKKSTATVSLHRSLPPKTSSKTPTIVLPSSSSSSSSLAKVEPPIQLNKLKNKRKRPVSDSSDSGSTVVFEENASKKQNRNHAKPPPPKQSKKVNAVYSSDESDSDVTGTKYLEVKSNTKTAGVKDVISEKGKKQTGNSASKYKEKSDKNEKTDNLRRDSDIEKKTTEGSKSKAPVANEKKERSDVKKDKSKYENCSSDKIKKEENTKYSSSKPQKEFKFDKKGRKSSTSSEVDPKPKNKDRKQVHTSAKEQEQKSKNQEKSKESIRTSKGIESKERDEKHINSKDVSKMKERESKSFCGKDTQTKSKDSRKIKTKEDDDVFLKNEDAKDVSSVQKTNSVCIDGGKMPENLAKAEQIASVEVCFDSSQSGHEHDEKKDRNTKDQQAVSSSTDNIFVEELATGDRKKEVPSTNELSNAIESVETLFGDKISSTQESQQILNMEKSAAAEMEEGAVMNEPKHSEGNEAVAKTDRQVKGDEDTGRKTGEPTESLNVISDDTAHMVQDGDQALSSHHKEVDKETPGPSHAIDKSGGTKKKSSGYEDPEFVKYKSKFKLKRFKMVITDIKKQERYHWREGDPVYRLWKKEQRKKKTLAVVQGHAQRHKFEKYDKKIKKGDNNLKREIVREKPLNKQLTDKEKLLEALHHKVPKGKDKRIDLGIVAKAGQSKPLFDGRVPKDFVATYNPFGSLLKPAIDIEKPKFDTNRLVTSTDKVKEKKSTWGMTAAEKLALENESRKRCVLPKIPKIQKPPSRVFNKCGKRNEPVAAVIDEVDFDFGNYFGDDDALHDEEVEEQNDYGSVADSGDNAPHVPVTEVRCTSLAKEVMHMFMKGSPEVVFTHWDQRLEPHEETVRKTADWFRLGDSQPYYQRAPSVPENAEEEFYALLMDDDGDDDLSWFGNVSNPDGDDLQDNEITSTARDPDQEDEYCGAGLLFAKYRIKSGEKEDSFASIFDVPKGSNYDKNTFQATCNLCNELITDKRQLSAHLRGYIHRTNLAKTSLKFVDSSQSILNKFHEDYIVEMDSRQLSKSSPKSSVTGRSSLKANGASIKKVGSDVKSVDKNGEKRKIPVSKDRPVAASTSKHNKEESSSKPEKEKERLKRSISKERESQRERDREQERQRDRNKARHRSRSPHKSGRKVRSRSKSPRHRQRRGSRSRSRSPSKRRISHGGSDSHSRKVEEFLSRNEKSARRLNSPTTQKPRLPLSSKQDEDLIFKEKLKLQANGIWNDDLEGRWKIMEDDQRRLKKLYAVKQKQLEEKPEDHPEYASQWGKFWEKRYAELEKKGKNPDTHDYTSEWKIVWGKISEQFLQKEHDAKLIETRIKYGVDLASLKRLNAQAPPPSPVQKIVPPAAPAYGSLPAHMPAATMPVQSPFFGNENQHMLVGPPMQVPGMVPPPMHPNTGYGPFVGVGYAPMMRNPGFSPVPVAIAPPPINLMAPPVNTGVMFMTGSPSISTVLMAEPNAPGTDSKDPSIDYSEKSMSISSAGSAASVKLVDFGQPKPTVTIDDIKSTWQNLTGQKIAFQTVEAKSGKKDSASVISVSSSSSSYYNYEGQNIIRTLTLMLELEDHLSFLADIVKEYFAKAQAYDKQKMDSSMGLLKEKAFVELLHRCRDKIFASLRANIAPSEVKAKLNRLVYALGILLESPKCLKIAPPPSNDSVTPTEERMEVVTSKSIVPGKASPEVQIIRQAGNPIAEAFAGVSYAKKAQISATIAKSYTAQGQDRWSSEDLLSSLINLVSPIRNDLQRAKNSSREVFALNPSTSGTGGGGNPVSRAQPGFDRGCRPDRYFSQPEDGSSHRDSWSGPSRDIPVSGHSNRGIGMPLPPLEGIRARPASPPAGDSRIVRESMTVSSPVLLPNPLARRDGGRNYRNRSSATESQVNSEVGAPSGKPDINMESPYSPRSYSSDLDSTEKTFKDQRHKEVTVIQSLESIGEHSKIDSSAKLPVPSLDDLNVLLDGEEQGNNIPGSINHSDDNMGGGSEASGSESVIVIGSKVSNEVDGDDQMKNLPPGIRLLIMKEKQNPGPSITEILAKAEKSANETREKKDSASSIVSRTESSGKRKRRKSKKTVKRRGSSKEDTQKYNKHSRDVSSRRNVKSRERGEDHRRDRRRSYDDNHREKRHGKDDHRRRTSHDEVRILRLAPPLNDIDSYPRATHSHVEFPKDYGKDRRYMEVEAHIRTVSEEFWGHADDLESIEDFPEPNNEISLQEDKPDSMGVEKKSGKSSNGSYRLHGLVDAEDGEIISSDDES